MRVGLAQEGIGDAPIEDRSLRAVLEVEDTGRGIDAADQPRIFDRFYRVLGTSTEGSGLGLAIVREIADQHQATVSVRSPVTRPGDGTDAGTCFQVSFPFRSTHPIGQ